MAIKIESSCFATEYVKYDYGKLRSCINKRITTAVH